LSLLTDLISYWKLDEASGDAIDANGTYNLTAVNAPGSGTGVINGDRTFTVAGSKAFTHTSVADLQIGTSDFTVSLHVKIVIGGLTQGVISKYSGVVGNREWRIYIDTSNRLNYQVAYNGTNSNNIISSALTVGQWYHVVAYRDSAANKIGMIIDDGAPATTSLSAAGFSGTSPFELGKGNSTGVYANIELDEIGFWKGRKLDASEITDLYNLTTYDDFGGGSTPWITPDVPFNEGAAPSAGDTIRRSLFKIAAWHYVNLGDHGPSYYPEGSQPLVGDNNERLIQKINAMRNA
jgi:Concanavalin A-like lectin/glucanases superfamily